MNATTLSRHLYADYVTTLLWMVSPQLLLALALPVAPHWASIVTNALLVLVLPWFLFQRHAEEITSSTALLPITTLLDTPRGLSITSTLGPFLGGLSYVIITLFFTEMPKPVLISFAVLMASFTLLGGMLFGLKVDERLRSLQQLWIEQKRESTASINKNWSPVPVGVQIVTLISSTLVATAALAASFGLLWNSPLPGAEFTPRSLVLCALAFVMILVAASRTGLHIGRRIADATRELRDSLDSFAAGRPFPPRWMSSDEIGQLAVRTTEIVTRLGQLVTDLRVSAERLSSASLQLGSATNTQNETLARQAAALQETEVTAQEIRQTSLLAAQKTEAMLRTAEQAEDITRAGEQAIELSLSSLTEISAEVSEMASGIRALGDRARQIASITATVKELADQSNMLALNAAIEAVRSGEHGKGFAVVAREIRSLADQSLQATRQVREILEDITSAIRATVATSENGSEKVRSSLVQVQSSGVSIRELSSILRDNAQSVRQISAAVGQQNAGIGQIFEAVRDLSRMMDGTLENLQSNEAAANLVSEVAEHVTSAVLQYGGSDSNETAPSSAA